MAQWSAAVLLLAGLPAARADEGPPPAAPVAAPAYAVTSIRFWSLGATTRVAIEVSGEVKFKYESLHTPERLFIDIGETRMKLGEKAIQVIQVGDKLIKQIRVAQKDLRTTRVVLDLEKPVEQEISQLANPNRIMVEVRSPGGNMPDDLTKRSRSGAEAVDTPSKTSRAKVEPAKSEPPKPEPPNPEPVKSEPAKPEAARPEPPRPEAAEPDPAAFVPPPSSGEPDDSPKPAKPTSTGGRSLTRALGLKFNRIVIDPGHGGHDHGTTGPTGLTEKELVLDVALRLGALLEDRMGTEVVYTRSKDVYIYLDERGPKANEQHADLFLSIHANASKAAPYVSGAEVYYLSFAPSRDALELAARENAGTKKSISELQSLLEKIALKDKLDESREFAVRLQASLASTWNKMNPQAQNRGVKRNTFVVLIGASMPAVLAEIGFITNPKDEAMLKKPEHRQRIAEALFKGVQNYVATLSSATPSRAANAPASQSSR